MVIEGIQTTAVNQISEYNKLAQDKKQLDGKVKKKKVSGTIA